MGKKLSTDRYNYDNRVWFWDSRPDPFKMGNPKWVTYSDTVSTIIDEHAWKFLHKKTDDPEVIIHPDYVVNVKASVQICLSDRKR